MWVCGLLRSKISLLFMKMACYKIYRKNNVIFHNQCVRMRNNFLWNKGSSKRDQCAIYGRSANRATIKQCFMLKKKFHSIIFGILNIKHEMSSGRCLLMLWIYLKQWCFECLNILNHSLASIKKREKKSAKI